MGKTHHRRMKEYEHDHDHDHIGWMSGIISLFDFRRGGSNHRLLSDKRYGNKVRGEGFSQFSNGSVNSGYRFDDDAHCSPQPMLTAGKQSGKSLIEEDMVTKGNAKLNRSDSFMEFVDFANEADANTLVREILIRIQQKGSGGVEKEQDTFYILPEKIRENLVNQMTYATKVILQEKLIGRVHVGLDGKIQYSREFIDALETLISNKDLFFKLLEDPNAELTRRVNNMINSELGKCTDQKESEGLHNQKPSPRRRDRSQEVRLLSSDDSSEGGLLNSAVLEPGFETYSSSYSADSYELKSKCKSYFSFTEIKRKLKQVMGKDAEDVFSKNAMARNVSQRDSFGRMSPTRNPHLEVEMHPKRLSCSSRWSDVDSTDSNDMAFENETVRPSEKNFTSSHLELRKPSLYFLNDETFYEKFLKKRDVEFTRKSFSMPDRAFLTSLRAARQSSLPTAHIRSSFPKRSLCSNDDAQVPELKNNDNAVVDYLSDYSVIVTPCKSDEGFHAKKESQDPSPIISENIVFGDREDAEKLLAESSSAVIIDADCDKQFVDDDGKAPSPIILADNYFGIEKTEHIEDFTGTLDNRPSPTSVLEPTYLEDEISPLHTKILQGELPIATLQIHFEEEENLSEFDPEKSPIVKKSCDDNEPKLKKYIEEILIASGFSWDTIYMRYLSSDQLLDTSLYDAEMDNSSDQLSNDYMLLLDLINEVLVDSCARYFSCSPRVSFSKTNKRPILDTENTFQEIVERVESHLHPSSNPQDVEQIVAEEIIKDESWKDFRVDVETVGTEIADLILQKLIIDTALSCFSFTDKPRLFHL